MCLVKTKQFKRHIDYGFFAQNNILSKISQLGGPLEMLNEGVDFEMFTVILETGFEKTAKGGRRPFDYVIMFIFFYQFIRKKTFLVPSRIFGLFYNQFW